MHIRVRCAGIVIKDKHILLMYRRKNGKEYYTFPGGAQELNETIEETIVRELLEETTIFVHPEQIFYRLHTDEQEEVFYTCSYISGEPHLSHDSEEAQQQQENNYYEPMWVDITSLPTLILYPLKVRDMLIQINL